MIKPSDLDVIQAELLEKPKHENISPEYDKILTIFKNSCRDMLKNHKASKFLFRGMDNVKEDIFVASPVKRRSESASSFGNYYTIILDNDPRWSEYPKRSNSFICGGTTGITSQYGETFRVFPFDSTKIAKCPSDDIWTVMLASGHNFRMFNALVHYLLVSHKINTNINYEQLRQLKFAPQEVSETMKKAKAAEGWSDFVKYPYAADLLEQCIYDGNRHEMTRELVMNLGEYIDNYFVPENLGFELFDIKDFKWNAHEYWFDGKALFIHEGIRLDIPSKDGGLEKESLKNCLKQIYTDVFQEEFQYN